MEEWSSSPFKCVKEIVEFYPFVAAVAICTVVHSALGCPAKRARVTAAGRSQLYQGSRVQDGALIVSLQCRQKKFESATSVVDEITWVQLQSVRSQHRC